jgi:hypothetical protein
LAVNNTREGDSECSMRACYSKGATTTFNIPSSTEKVGTKGDATGVCRD